MACCAAAAFFISQIVLAFESTRRRLFGGRARVDRRNDVVSWTLGAATNVTAVQPKRAPIARRLIVAALVAEGLLIAGSATAWTAYRAPADVPTEQGLWALAMSSICTSGALAESRQQLTNRVEGK